MADGPKVSPEVGVAAEPVMVDLGNGQIGHEIKDPGQSFALGNMFDRFADQLGGDKFSEVYFRTESGNIYVLNDYGLLVDGNESQKAQQTGKGKIAKADLDGTKLENTKLVVGEPFDYGGGGKTTRIIEIVATNQRGYVADYLESATNGRKNTIESDFRAKVPVYSYSRAVSASSMVGLENF